MKIGIRSEDKSQWERRVPLVPQDAADLRAAGIDVVVQQSARRAFTEDEFRSAGVPVQEDVDDCRVIVGIKEIPPPRLAAGKTYLFFPHVIKGQPANMPMLRRLMELKATLIDYERIVDENNRRLIFFGRHAGLAGMVNTLWSLGRRLEALGTASPFARLKQARTYADLSGAREDLQRVASRIAEQGVPADLHPLVIGFTGYGNVSGGAQEILDILPTRSIAPDEVAAVARDRSVSANVVYKVVLRESDVVEPIAPGRPFDLADYFRSGASAYRSVFGRYADHLSVLVNCIYWDSRYPRVLTIEDCRRMWSAGRPRLLVVGDISCDVGGSVECTVKATDPGNPVYVYDPATGIAHDGFEGEGPLVMAVEILPSEIPRESSVDFSRVLKPMLSELSRADLSAPFADLALPAALKRGIIVHRGELTPDYEYLREHVG